MIGNLSLRLATRDDAAAIARMSRDLIEQGLGWSWTTPRVLRSVRSADTNAVLALKDQRIAGFAIMKYGDAEAHLLLLAVQPSAQRRGVGTALTRWVEASALVAGIGQVYLEVRAGNAAARAFYERHGFMRGPGVKDVLDPIIERYGRDRHLTFYLDELSARMKARRS